MMALIDISRTDPISKLQLCSNAYVISTENSKKFVRACFASFISHTKVKLEFGAK